MADLSPTSAKVLDLFFATPGKEPDWEAIYFTLFQSYNSPYQIEMELLRQFWEVYEKE